MSDAFYQLPQKQRERCQALFEACRQLQRLTSGGMPVSRALKTVCNDFAGRTLADGQGRTHRLKLSEVTLRRAYRQWKRQPTLATFAPQYKSPKIRIPEELILEYQRRCTLPGMEEYASAYDSLVKDWRAGREIPGLGTWQQWWVSNPKTQPFPLPQEAPDFPVSDRGLLNHKPGKALKIMGTRGMAEALKYLPHNTNDTSGMAPARFYVSDDVRLDLICIDESTGRPTEMRAYIMMDWATRYIPAFVLRPATAILQADVDAMIARGLQTLGIGKDYTTFLYFERGTVACSNDAQRLIEQASEGRIKIIRTGMNGGERWPGAGSDQTSGHWMGKAVIERFMLELHRLLRDLPGQRGSDYTRTPANLGWLGANSEPVKQSLAAQAQQLAQINLAFNSRLRLKLPLLTFNQVNMLLREAIKRHNTNDDHNYQGFGKKTLQEIAPGSWRTVA